MARVTRPAIPPSARGTRAPGLHAALLLVVPVLLILADPAWAERADRDILRALALASTTEIPPDNVRCEITGPSRMTGDEVVYASVTVADFLAGFMATAASPSEHAIHFLECEGADSRQCTLSYGRRASEDAPAYDVYLRFELDAGGRLVTDSLACIGVP